MFHRLIDFMQMRRSTAFLLTRADDRLLDDIGLTRADLEAMHLGTGARQGGQDIRKRSPGRALPVAG